MRSISRRSAANTAILIDTHVLAWVGLDDPRLSRRAILAISDGAQRLLVSAVRAYESVDLNRRGRFGADLPLSDLLNALAAEVIGYPAECWSVAATLPPLHRDPVDRMLIAHAMYADLTLVTADETMRAYPVRTLW